MFTGTFRYFALLYCIAFGFALAQTGQQSFFHHTATAITDGDWESLAGRP